MITLNTPVSQLPAVGPARAKALEKLGLRTAGDLLFHLPRHYEDRREHTTIASAPAGRPVCITALVAEEPEISHVRKGLSLVKVKVVDEASTLRVTFFNQLYVKANLRVGESYVFYGTVEGFGRIKQMNNPVFEPEAPLPSRIPGAHITGCIVPVYPLSAGLSSNLISGLVRRVLSSALKEVVETLPPSVLETYQLLPVQQALPQVHFPKDFDVLEEGRRRMIFEELFSLTAGLALLKGRRAVEEGPRFACTGLDEFLSLLPFAPTGAQRRVMAELMADTASGPPMNRLVQGDVGSGKTVIAACGAWLAWKSGWQSALMAPTEILAEQHYQTLTALLAPAGMKVGLLTGAMKAAEKRAVYAALASGEIDLLVGTHALITGKVEFQKLGLVVADEQHRFGVNQRAALAAKSDVKPHVLVMSATPIPRTLALIIYGDLDVSILDELPPGRTPVATYVVGEDKRARMYNFVRKLVAEGRQAYLVCPAVEENPDLADGADGTLFGGQALDLKAVTTYAQELKTKVFPDLRVGFVHGRLKAKDKESVMSAFAAGELDILVSTTVIEVGVDVPNAALMIIENAERFGLSQLHQLRGRVGRGSWQSYCVLVTSSKNQDSRARLKVLASTTDGFKIAEEDLNLRGPGDFFGARQHGLPQLKVADFASDIALLRQAQDAAQALVADDPELERPEHQALRERVRTLFAENPDIFN